jgi:hypothetical protein
MLSPTPQREIPFWQGNRFSIYKFFTFTKFRMDLANRAVVDLLGSGSYPDVELFDGEAMSTPRWDGSIDGIHFSVKTLKKVRHAYQTGRYFSSLSLSASPAFSSPSLTYSYSHTY